MPVEFDEEKRAKPRKALRASGEPPGKSGLQLLPVLQKQSDHPCFECVKCCTYVATEIDAPTTMNDYDHIVWYLYHEGVSVFVDWSGDWYLSFETRCRNLTAGGLCAIYERRPAICKDFDWRECENHLKDEPPDKWLFEEAEQFLDWFEKQRPRTFARYQRFLREKHASGEEPELGRVRKAGPAAAASRR